MTIFWNVYQGNELIDNEFRNFTDVSVVKVNEFKI